jgi:hypothetical protein
MRTTEIKLKLLLLTTTSNMQPNYIKDSKQAKKMEGVLIIRMILIYDQKLSRASYK